MGGDGLGKIGRKAERWCVVDVEELNDLLFAGMRKYMTEVVPKHLGYTGGRCVGADEVEGEVLGDPAVAGECGGSPLKGYDSSSRMMMNSLAEASRIRT